MTSQLAERVIAVVQDTLRTHGDDPDLAIGATDSMDTVLGWDSLQFMNVFLAVNEAFALDPDFDEAIHYTAIPTLVAYVQGQTW